MFNTECTFFYALTVRAGRKLRLSAQASVQMFFRQTKNTHSLRSKYRRTKDPSSREMEKQATFLTLSDRLLLPLQPAPGGKKNGENQRDVRSGRKLFLE